MSDFGTIIDQARVSNQHSNRTGSITRVIWHHQASTNDDATIGIMISGAREVSSTYTVDNKDYGGRGWARITGVVPERFRPWTSDSAVADGRALTIEVCNASAGPGWAIAGVTHEACARIAAYANQAYGVPLQRATPGNLSGHMGHNEVYAFFPGSGYATYCPGHLDVNWIIERAKQLIIGSGGAPIAPPASGGAPPPTPPASNSGFNPFDGVHFNLASGHYYGLVTGPAESHGGAFAEERAPVKKIQQRLQVLGYAPKDAGWADGLFEQATADSVSAWQHAAMPGTEYYGQVWGDDWDVLFGGAAPAPVPTPPASGQKIHQGAPVPGVIAQGSGQYFGLITGPPNSLGGYNESERQPIRMLQQRLIACGFVPGIGDPSSGWADGIFEQPTADAVAAFQHAHMPGTEFFGQCWWDDWTKLFSL